MADITTPTWRDKHKIGEIMTRLGKHTRGEADMTQTQVAAARLYLDKTLPSLSSIDSNTTHGGKIEHVVTWSE